MLELPIDGLKFDQFEEKELRSLKLFHEQIKQILESRIIRTNSMRCYINLDFMRSEVTAEFPDEDDLRSFVTLVRACLLQGNPNYHKTVLAALRRRSEGETLSYINKASELFFR